METENIAKNKLIVYWHYVIKTGIIIEFIVLAVLIYVLVNGGK